MPKSRQKKEARVEEVQKFLLEIPRDLHTEVKVLAFREHRTMSEVISEAVALLLATKGGKKN